MSNKGRRLGVDLGEKKIGLALSDPLSLTAQGLSTLEVKTVKEAVKGVAEVAAKTGATEIVLGLPLNMNGTDGPQATKARRFGRELEKECAIPVILWDERLSSRAAERLLLEAGISRRRRREKLDRLAAQLILQSYLDLKNREKPA